ncbi:hypothetical protein QQS21_005130 [Conoideocrella luteorostrata]|uniref:Carrier domain-containing protein n=1 Tax=Conoideocrella luteorostrata TaxID=1105319 RepID=A0AAJ0CPZ6_9HYPO|nr:hypothetical protein QQS21_005130 [Conoideocrella luteorostrata]
MDVEDLWVEALVDRPTPPFASPAATGKVQLGHYLETPVQELLIDEDLRTPNQASHCFLVAWALIIGRYSQTDAILFGFHDGQSTWPIRLNIGAGSLVQHLFSQILACSARFEKFHSADHAPVTKASDRANRLQKLSSMLRFEYQDKIETSSNRTGNDESDNCPVMVNCCLDLPERKAQLTLRYAENVLSSYQADRVLCQYVHTINSIRKCAADRLISDIDICPPRDYHQMRSWNGPTLAPASQCIHQVIEDVVKSDPDAQAIEGWDSSFTYRELNDASFKLAAQLQHVGVQKETIVPLCFEKSAWTVVAMLAVLRAGGAFMLLDPNHPEDRLKSMIKRVGGVREMGPVVCSQIQLEFCMRLSARAIVVDAARVAEWPLPSDPLMTDVGPDNTAIIQHTSGTTGFPKAIEVTHSSYCSSARAHGPEFGVGPGRRIYQFSSYSFDACLAEIVTGLMGGACILVPKDTDRTDRLAESITELGTNWLLLTPSSLRLLQPQDIPTVETLVSGGESVDQYILDTWATHVKFFQVWGPSETGVYATSDLVSNVNGDPGRLGCIGRPLGCRIWIVDTTNVDRLAPIGCTGELVVEGPTVARGYAASHGDSTLAFLEAPDWSGNNERGIRAYRTGDLGRYNSDGSIMFLGRKDTQIKYHGQRIELADIEQNIVSHPSIAHCVVLYPNRGGYAGSIVAILEFRDTTSRNVFTPSEFSELLKTVKDSASKKLPSYMLPTAWLFTPRIPLNQSSKIDRAALLQEIQQLSDRHGEEGHVLQVETQEIPSPGNPTRDESIEARPTSEVSKIISASFKRALKRKISPNSSFISQGGDSISAMRIVGNCWKKGVKLTFKDVLTAENLGQLTQLAIAQPEKSDTSEGKKDKDAMLKNLEEAPIKKDNFDQMTKLAQSTFPKLFDMDNTQIEGVYPCSPAQEGILLSQAKDPEKYAISYWFEISPSHAADLRLSASRLEAAWNIVVQRHQPFRTVFLDIISEHGPFAQLVFQSVAPEFIIHSDPSELAGHIPLHIMGSKTLPHRFRVSIEANTLLCKLEVSHAVMDGISVKIILEELALAYEGKLAMGSTFLYRDYISHVLSLPKKKTMEYWSQYLDGMAPCHLKLPQQEQKLVPDRCRLESLELALRIHSSHLRLLEKKSIPIAALLQAAWALVLSAYTGQDEISFAYVVSGRDAPAEGIDVAVGLFINTLICRLSLNQSASVLDCLRAVQSDYMKGSAFQHASIADIMHTIRSTSGSLFNTLVSIIHHWDLATPPGTRLQYKHLEIDENTEFDMTMTATISQDGVGIRLDYWNNIFSRESVQRVMKTFHSTVNSLLVDITRPLSDLTLISDVDILQLGLWNNSRPRYLDTCIHEVISEQVKARPRASAICSWDKSFTYRELDRVTDTFASALLVQPDGVSTNTVVPICMEKSAWAIVAMLSVLKAGGGFVMLDPAHPIGRLIEIVRQIGASQVIVSKTTATKCGELACPMFECSEEAYNRLRTHEWSPPFLSNRSGPQNIAYIMFTSGSTGQPKGVVTEHGAYCSAVSARTEAILRDENSRHLQYASYNFDVCIEDILTTLMVGGCVCVPSEAERMDDIAAAIRRMGVNSAELTPTVAAMILPEDVPSLKVLVLSGEAVTSSILRKWASSVQVINSYGPTESSVTSVVAPRSHASQLHPSAIGYGVGAVTWIVNRHNHNKLSPIGAIGELLLEGPGLSRGYLGDQTTTDQSFIRNPSWLDQADPVRRFYKTGDLAQYLRDGSLVYRGRKDNQVKINGQRVELGEIDARFQALLAWPATVVSVLALATARSARPVVASFLTVEGDFAPSDVSGRTQIIPMNESLRLPIRTAVRKLSQTLPSFMMPGLYLPLATMPTTTSGKIDTRRLMKFVEQLTIPQLLDYSLETSSPRRQPKTPAETQLQELWSQVLCLEADTIGAEDSFVRLGGDSVLTMQLAAAARGSGLSLTVAMIFKNPRLSDMARVAVGFADGPVEEYDHVPKPFELVNRDISQEVLFKDLARFYSIEENQVEDVYPCTPLQEGLMAASTRQKTAYTARIIRRLEPGVSFERLELAWNQVLANQAILRTRLIHSSRLGSLQVVMRAVEGHFLYGSNLAAYIEADKTKAMHHGQNLSRCGIVTERGKSYFVWTVHHAIYDGWVLDSILEQVVRAYDGGQTGVSEAGPPFKMFIGYLLGQNNAHWKSFWKEQLQGFQPVDFPVRPPTSQSIRADRSHHYQMKLSSIPDGRDYTAATLIRAAWALVVSKYTESDDICFGSVLTGRTATVKGITEIIGPTFTTVPVRLDISQYETVSSLLSAVQSQTVDMMPFEHAGLQNIAALDDHCRAACDFQNLLVIQPKEIKDTKIGFFASEHMSDEANLGFHAYPLVLGCTVEANSAIELHMNFDTNAISEAEINWLYQHLFTAITRLSSILPDTRVVDVDLFNDFDDSTIRKWNSVDVIQQDCLIHEEILKQVSAQPSAEAVFAWDRCLSYNELDTLSTQLADHLTSRGYSGQEVLIPLLFEKSSWVPVSMLAVLKSGAGFVPLDASHPPSRLQEIIRQANAPVVLISKETAHLSHLCPAVIEVTQDLFDKQSTSSLPGYSMRANTQVLSHQSKYSQSSESSNVTSSDGTIDYTPSVSPVTSTRREFLGPERETPGQVHSSNVAYVIFTSGSTGKPKGVVIEHGQFCSGVIGPRKEALVRSTESRVLQFASLSFDTSLEDILTTLLFGGCVCIPSEYERLNDIEAFINRSRANTAHITPSFANTLTPDHVPTLKFLRLGGEAMTLRHVNTWANVLDLRNVYGPTETAITATCSTRVTAETNHANIGKGVAARIWIVNPEDHDKLTPLGLVGEMLVEGPLLARGYLHDVEKTAKSFISNPRWAVSDGPTVRPRFYKTGDLCRYDGDGNILYVGRKDTQVKINGQRIELGEVEDHLREALPKPLDVAVEALSVPGITSRKDLVAMICLGDAYRGDQDDINSVDDSTIKNLHSAVHGVEAAMAKTVPKYMVPARFLPIKVLPMTAARKTDRRKLQIMLSALSPDQMKRFSATGECRQPPQTGTERLMQSLWASALQIQPEQVSADDNFLRIGGDSIMAIRLGSLCRDVGFSVSVTDIFTSMNLREMASLVDQMQMENNSQRDESQIYEPFSMLAQEKIKTELFERLAAKRVMPNEVQDAYPCTPLQEGLLSLSLKTGEAYISQTIFTLPSETDLDRFKQAWEFVVAENDILRTRILNLGSQATLQVVLKQFKPDWHDIQDLPSYLPDSVTGLDTERELASYALYEREDAEGSRQTSFVLTVHHAAYDGWSLSKLLDQVNQAYTENKTATTATGTKATEKTTGFANFIRYLHTIPDSAYRQYWETKLSGTDEVSDLPVSTLIPGEQDPTMANASVQIPFNLPHGEKVTASVLIRAAWALTISQYAGASDVVYGATVLGRTADVANIASVIGPTIATIPIRVKIDGNATIGSFFQYLLDDMVGTMPFEQYGLQNIQSINVDAKRLCNFKSLLVIQPTSTEELAEGLFANPEAHNNLHIPEHPYPVSVEARPHDETIDVYVRFDSRAVSEKHMSRVLQTLRTIITELCGDTSRHVSDINSISKSDIEDVLLWNQTMPESVEDTVQSVLEAKLSNDFAAQALYSKSRSLTYGELSAVTESIAHRLNNLRIGPGSFVPLLFEKSVWHTIAMIGVIRAGATFVPLDPYNLPAARLKQIVSQCGAKILLTSKAVSSGLEQIRDVEIVEVDAAEFSKPEISFREPPLQKATPKDALYVIFTSGTTGTPKGVVISNRAFVSVLSAKLARDEIGLTSRVLQFASHGFDMSIDDILLPLLSGGCVCVPDEETRLSGLEEFIAEAKVDSATMTPSAAATLDASRTSKYLKKLRLGGEYLREVHIQQWIGHVDLKNRYGPTEVCDACLASKSIKKDYGQAGNLGTACGTVTWVVDQNDHSKLVPIGAVGELCIQGPGLSDRYLHDSERTAAAIVPSPNWGHQLMPMYKSGDLVRYADDGSLIYVQRKDSQIKLRGLRIELGEVEYHIGRIEELKSISFVVDVRSADGTDSDILAVFMTETEYSVSHCQRLMQVITARLNGLVPGYMIPTHLLLVTAIPLTTSGKTDRRRLRQLAGQALLKTYIQAEADTAFKEPRDPKELMMREVWASLLRVDEASIGTNHNFFQMGGDSITVMRLISILRSRNIGLQAQDVFIGQTLECVAKLSTVRTAGDEKEIVHLPDVNGKTTIKLYEHVCTLFKCSFADIDKILPATDFQAWCIAQSSMQCGGWRNSFIYEFDNDFDVGRLQRACHRLVEQHEILRTRFIAYGAVCFQIVLHFSPAKYLLDPFTFNTGEPYDMNETPIQFCVDQTGKKLIMRISHALYDGLSRTIITDELLKLYYGDDVSPTHAFSAYSAAALDHKNSEAVLYWREFLRGAGVTSLVQHNVPSCKNIQRSTLITTIPAMKPKFATAFTPATALKAAWAMVLRPLSQTDDVTFASLVQTRNMDLPGIDHIVGPCLNFLPARVRLARDTSIHALLEEVQSQHIRSMSHANLGFRQMIERCTDWPKWTRFSSIVHYQGLDQPHGGKTPSNALREIDAFVPESDSCDVWVSAAARGDSFEIKVHYCSTVISDEHAEILMKQLCANISRCVNSTQDDVAADPMGEPQEEKLTSLAVAPIQSGNHVDGPVTPEALDIVRQAWETVFGEDAAKTDSPFWNIWGDVVAASELARLYAAHGFVIAVEEVMESPTVLEQARLLSKIGN